MAALTSRGIRTQQAEELGELIGNILANEIENSKANKTVVDIVNSLHWYY
jgi:glycine/serine hydroxymethyltransferase